MVHSLCPRLHITVALVTNTTICPIFLTLVLSHHSRVHKPLDHCDIALTLTSTPTRIQDTDKQISTRHVLYYTKTWSTKFPKWMKDFPSWFVDYKVHSTANVVTAHQIQ